MENAHRPELDAGRALQQMELVAWDEGLGTCFVGLRDADQNRRVKELLGVPEGMVMVTLLPFGYRPEAGKAPGKPRKPMSQIAHRELFGRAYHAV
jgi:nitroreductase